MLNLKENVNLAKYSTFRIGGQARFFCSIKNTKDLKELNCLRRKLNMPLYILGQGSNTIFSDKRLNILVAKIEFKGIDIVNSKIQVNAGELWDEFVALSIKQNFSGLEPLSGIPGTVGAGPVQNIGAYLQEIKNFISEIQVYDLQKNALIYLAPEKCAFGYRTSIFKTKAKNRFIITSIVFKLKKQLGNLSGQKIRKEILALRKQKLPNPKILPNVGSFFQNPILKQPLPNAPFFKMPGKNYKIPAGWLIEQAGLKGIKAGRIGTYENNALVLVNFGSASFQDLKKFIKYVQSKVFDKFKILLKIEPEIVE